MPRFLPIQLDAANPEIEAVYHQVETQLGYLPNFIKTLAHSPNYLKVVAEMYTRVMSPESSLGDALRQLVILRSCQLDKCKPTVDLHTGLAREAGVSEDQIAMLADSAASDLFDFYEKDALALVEQIHSNPDDIPQDRYWTQLDNHFTSDQVVEMIVLVGVFGLVNRFIQVLQIQPDPVPVSG